MQAGIIKHADMLRRLNNGEVCALTFVTYNRKTKTGGEIITLENCRKHQAGKTVLKSPSGDLGVLPSSVVSGPLTAPRNPNHERNGTINIKTAGQEIKKVHTRLITKFNQLEVVL